MRPLRNRMRPRGPQVSRETTRRIQSLVDDLRQAPTTHWTFVPWPLFDHDRDRNVSWASQGLTTLPEIQAWVESFYDGHDSSHANDPHGLRPLNSYYDADPGGPSGDLQRALVEAEPDGATFYLCTWQVSNHFRDPPADLSGEALVTFRDRSYVPTKVGPEDIPNPGREVLLVHGDGAWLVAVGLAAFETLPGDLVLSRVAIDQLVSPQDHDLVAVRPEDRIG